MYHRDGRRRNAFSFEFFPKNFLNSTWPANYYLRFLRDTRDPREENNLYPFLLLLPEGNLLISLDYTQNRVVKEFPVIPEKHHALYLSCSWLSGTIHSNSTLFLFPHLHSLNLAFNNFSGSSVSSGFGLT